MRHEGALAAAHLENAGVDVSQFGEGAGGITIEGGDGTAESVSSGDSGGISGGDSGGSSGDSGGDSGGGGGGE